jgi:hypothetical protein
MRERFLDYRFPPPHGSNVHWSDMIVIIDKLKIYPATSELSYYFKVERQTYGLHLFRDICDDVVGKRLGCGTAYQHLPRSPYIQDTTALLETSLASPQGGSGGGVLLRPREWRGRHRVSTRDWNLMLNSNSSLTGGQKHTHTHTHLAAPCDDRPDPASPS